MRGYGHNKYPAMMNAAPNNDLESPHSQQPPGNYTVQLKYLSYFKFLFLIQHLFDKSSIHSQPQCRYKPIRCNIVTIRCQNSSPICNKLRSPLRYLLQLLPSGSRFRVPLARKNIYKNSCIPSAIGILNNIR